MALIPYYLTVDGKRKRDPLRQFKDTETGEIVSRYQQLKRSYGGITPEQRAKVRSGEYDTEGNKSDSYYKALRQFRKHHPNQGEDSPEWQSLSTALFAHYPSHKGTTGSHRVWERRKEAIQALWYDYDDFLDDDSFGDYVSPKQGEE